MNYKDVNPNLKRYFPWALFLVLAALFSLAACSLARGDDKPPCYGQTVDDHTYTAWPECRKPQPEPKPSFSVADWTCEKLRDYLSTHTEAEARAQAVEMHLPKWIIRKAERCIK